MASFTAFLEVSGKQYPLQRYELGMRQEIDHLGRPASPVLGVVISCTLHSPVSSDSFLYQWMLSPTMQQDGKIRLLQAGAKATEKTISFFNAYCIDMNLNFFPGLSAGMGSSWLQLQISPQRVAVGAIVHDNNWPLDSHGAGETFSLAAYQANSVTAKAPKPPKPAICAQVADATDMRKSKKERYNARLAVIDASSAKLKEVDLQPERAVMAADATRVAGGKPSGKSTPSFSEALAANRRFELNNRAIERAKLTNAIYLLDKKKFYESQDPPQPEKFKEMLAAQTWPTEKNGLPEGWGMIERSVPGKEPVYAVYQSTFEQDAKPILVFRGTDNAVNAKADWMTNLLQGNGFDTKQYNGSINLATRLARKYNATGGIEIAGHSKAGGQAAAAGIISGAKTYTFNAAGVHPRTLSRMGNYSLDMARKTNRDGQPLVDAFNFPHDILNNLQDTAIPALKGGLMVAPSLIGKAVGAGLTLNNTMPMAAGVRHIVPAQDSLGNKIASPWNPMRRVDYHGMPYLIDSMEKQKKDDLKTLSAYLGCQ
ncbi:type VI secretion system tube protein TssD [Fibrella sp. WM1]|uniref:type VI secretion system tube protein TssD n=1 Tax=Fibrella musci TaxID=3242485 RepID=UPI0035229466